MKILNVINKFVSIPTKFAKIWVRFLRPGRKVFEGVSSVIRRKNFSEDRENMIQRLDEICRNTNELINKKPLIVLVYLILIFTSTDVWADEWDQIENEFTIKFQNQLEPFFPQQKSNTLSIDEFSLMTGVFTEYSIFLLNIRVQPYVKFHFSKTSN